jgi:apolipoprotein N-acyltransferase
MTHSGVEDGVPWWAASALSVLTVTLLTLSAAPYGHWYLAWVCLAPWLVAVGLAPTFGSALRRGLLAGIAYFAVNLWWLWTASITGTVVLIAYFGMYWALAAGALKTLGLLSPSRSTLEDSATSASQTKYGGRQGLRIAGRVVAVALAWVAAEWLRANVAAGFPWLPLGSTQSPLPAMCQVADLGGPWIVSFWLVLPNALLAVIWIERRNAARTKFAVVMVAAILVTVAAYGAWRLHSTSARAGLRVMVIQSNVPHLPGGAPTVDRQTAAEYLLTAVESSLAEQSADLVILPEAMFPPINDEARRTLAHAPIGPSLENTYQRLLTIARAQHAALLVGGNAVTGWVERGTEHIGTEIRNSAYFIDPMADQPVSRYDKVHLARFSERAPLAIGPEWLRRLAMVISANRAEHPLTAGEPGEFAPFHIVWPPPRPDSSNANSNATAAAAPPVPSRGQFICPICLENIDPAIVAGMAFDSSKSQKRADFIANLSNDGWFAALEKHQHWQTTIFRCIENRVPMARSSNTGISGFIDSCGRVQETMRPGAVGPLVRQIELATCLHGRVLG